MAKQRASNGFLDTLLGLPKQPSGNDRANATAEVIDFPRTNTPGHALAPEREAEPLPAVREDDAAEEMVTRLMALRAAPPPEEAAETLATLGVLLHDLNRKTVIVVFLLGKVLALVKASLPHGEFTGWIEANCSFTQQSARNYMAVYERYKGSPKKALADLTLTEAYIEAGVKKLGAPEIGERPRRYGSDEEEEAVPPEYWDRLFKEKTLSGKPLKYYRPTIVEDGSIGVVRKGYGLIPVCDLRLNMGIQSPTYQVAVNEVHQNIRMALEVFYEKIEVLEDMGEIPKPPSLTRKELLAEMEKPKPAALPAPKKRAAKGGV